VTEFELIERYFARPPRRDGLAHTGVGDDCALLEAGDRLLAVTSDMLLEGRHFLPGCDPAAIGHKSLAVNLSDLAAAGALPRCFFLALALPRPEPGWLEAFARGMLALADRHDCQLLGGDTTRTPLLAGAAQTVEGPLTISITAIGEVPGGAQRTRGGARIGDDLWVSGTVGDARLALAHARGELQLREADYAAIRARMEWPTPRVALGIALRGLATSAIDVSDGLLGDLGHVARRSGVAAEIDTAALPRSPVLRAQSPAIADEYALAGGDDYELLFTAPAEARAQVLAAARSAATDVSRIGRICGGEGVVALDAQGRPLPQRFPSFDHFRA
jgi:thiamine-monophosphate kinase